MSTRPALGPHPEPGTPAAGRGSALTVRGDPVPTASEPAADGERGRRARRSARHALSGAGAISAWTAADATPSEA